MRFNPRARVDDSQVEERAGSGGGGGLGGGGMRLPIPTGGRMGLGTIVILVLLFVLAQCLGLTGGGGTDQNATSNGQNTGQNTGQDACQTGADANSDPYGCGINLLTNSIQDYWSRALPQQAQIQYQDIRTVKYSGQTSSGCGTASSAMGPFYCPNDKRVYIDISFMQQMLQGQLGAKGGPFALAYVLAHEYGHHIQDQLGILGQIRSQQGPQSDSVKAELMADCLAGAWAKDATTTKDAQGQVIIQDLTQDDIARAIDAAQAVGDDRIQQESQGRVSPEAWTHGSSAERVKWFNTGLQQGTIDACNTFKAGSLG